MFNYKKYMHINICSFLLYAIMSTCGENYRKSNRAFRRRSFFWRSVRNKYSFAHTPPHNKSCSQLVILSYEVGCFIEGIYYIVYNIVGAWTHDDDDDDSWESF